MLFIRSKEEVLQLREEMGRYETGLTTIRRKIEDIFQRDHKSDDILVRGKAFIMQSELKRLDRLLNDCDIWFRGAVSAYSRNNRVHVVVGNNEDDSDDENDCESSDDNEEPLSDDEADFGENIDNCDAEEIDDSTSDDSIALN